MTTEPNRKSKIENRKSRSSIWFFIILTVLAISGISYEIWFNLKQQLKPEHVAAARHLWEEMGPRDYTMHIAVNWEDNPDPATSAADPYTVVVRGGKVQSVTPAEGQKLPPREYVFGTMDGLFDLIEKQLADDAEPGSSRAFVKATFDPDDGHVVHYVHSVMRRRERLEISVRLETPP
jgi:hypothetical protein